MYQPSEDELAILDRIDARLEAYLEECGDTDAPAVILIEEELNLVRELVRRAETEES